MQQTRSPKQSRGRQAVFVLLFGSVLFRAGFDTKACGAELSPAVKRAIDRGLAYLRAKGSPSGGMGSLVAYTMLTAGENKQSPFVIGQVKQILSKVEGNTYSPGGHHYYEAAVDLITLEAVDRIGYRPQMEAIVEYILAGQKSDGQWHYPTGAETDGDTSISQYALLALWAAQRAGIDIPGAVWDKAAGWFTKTQFSDGSFTYHPPQPRPISFHSMTTAGVGSLFICRMHLYPDRANPLGGDAPPPKPKDKFGGVLKAITGKFADENNNLPGKYRPTITEARMNRSIVRGTKWLTTNFEISNRDIDAGHCMYYLYTLERMASLAGIVKLGTHDWYAEGSQYLIKIQESDGRWTRGYGSAAIDKTAFGILFLSRATGKLVGTPAERFGDGLMRGGAELTQVQDFSELEIVNGVVRVRKNLGPLDELLAELANSDSVNFAATTKAIVEKVQLGDREGLIGNKALLLKLVKNPQPEVRRIALWAFARTADFGDLPVLMKSLDDPSIDVVVEGHNALCFLSRNLRGFGLPASPLETISEDATVSQKQAAFNKWRADVRKQWKAWALKVRPYEDRNDIDEVGKR
jgi:hypothetical protein